MDYAPRRVTKNGEKASQILMLKNKIEKLVDELIDKEISKMEDRELIVHGLITGLELLLNTVTTIVLGFLFGLVLESLIFSISFSKIRSYAGGYHCKKATNCYILSSGMVICVLGVVKFTPSNYMLVEIISIFLLLISVPVILKLAPVETPTKPLDKEETLYFRKKTVQNLITECVTVGILFCFGFHSIAYVISVGILLACVLVFCGNFWVKD